MKKKTQHIYADMVIAKEHGKPLKSCYTCGQCFIGRPNFCPECYQTEKCLRAKLLRR